MECKFDPKLIHDYADNDIGGLEKIFVEEHLKYCSKCNEELNSIRSIENGLKDIFNEIDLPERLDVISELIVNNCLSQLSEENLNLIDIVKDYRDRKKNLKHITKIYVNNPYNNFLKSSVNSSIEYIKKPLESYLNKKFSSKKLFDFMKIG